jgi:hypothetical protein
MRFWQPVFITFGRQLGMIRRTIFFAVMFAVAYSLYVFPGVALASLFTGQAIFQPWSLVPACGRLLLDTALFCDKHYQQGVEGVRLLWDGCRFHFTVGDLPCPGGNYTASGG